MKLTLNDGKVFENSHAIEIGNDLFVYVQDGISDIRAVFENLIDAKKTSNIEYEDYGEHVTLFNGFSRLIAVRDEGNGLITAVLCKNR